MAGTQASKTQAKSETSKPQTSKSQTSKSDENPKTDPKDVSNQIKDPSEWTTGGEPMTGAQASYLKTLSEEAKDPEAFDPISTRPRHPSGSTPCARNPARPERSASGFRPGLAIREDRTDLTKDPGAAAPGSTRTFSPNVDNPFKSSARKIAYRPPRSTSAKDILGP